jgi:hypothetical protein
MSSSWQTIVALVIVALAAAWLVRSAARKSRTPGCGSEGCGTISPDVRALRRKVRKP